MAQDEQLSISEPADAPVELDRQKLSTLLECFAILWPRAGMRCIALHVGDRWHHHFFNDDLTAARFALQSDLRADTQVYFALATFNDDSGRKGSNAQAARALWLDIDVGDGKPYATQSVALRAVEAFCDKLGLPMPLVVISGRGLHLYWPLNKEIDPETWLSTALALKAATIASGLHADPSRTADIASILRPPGTHNKKGALKCVRTVGGVQAVEHKVFRDRLSQWIGAGVEGPWVGVNDDLKSGFGLDSWFEWLSPDQKDACLEAMLDAVADLADAGRDTWLRIVMACARSGAPRAEVLCRGWSMTSNKYRAGDFDIAFASVGG